MGWAFAEEYTITVKNHTITASEWLAWRKQGLSNTEISALLNISPSMARIIARKFREAGVPDPQYRKRKPGFVGNLNTMIDSGAYVLGILWGTASTFGEGYWVRHRQKWYVDVVREYLGITAEGHESYSNTGSQWRLKITRAAEVATIKNLLERYGWVPRKSRERPYPSGSLNDRGFSRAWVELHSSADIVRTGRQRMPTPRLRIYGSQPLMEKLNRVIALKTNLPPKKLQRITTGTGETWCLYFFGRSCRAMIDWLYAGTELFNSTARNQFEKVLLQTEKRAGK